MAKSFSELLHKAKKSDDFWADTTILEFNEELSECIEKEHLSRSELAARVGVSPPYITKVLRGSENLTVMTMVKLARGVGRVLRLHLAPAGTRSYWVDTPNADEHIGDKYDTWDEQRKMKVASVSTEAGQNDDVDIVDWQPKRRTAA